MPFTRNEVADYEKKRYRGLDQRLVHNREQKILKKIFDKVGVLSGLALDLPCGYGRFSAFLLDKGFGLINCDISLAMVERANENTGWMSLRAQRGNLTTTSPRNDILSGAVADATAGLPFKGDVFSLVFSLRFFHHVHHSEDRRKILNEYARVSSGWVVLSYYQSNALHKIQRKFRRQIKKTPTRIKMISRQKFQSQAEEAGFEVVSVFPLFWGLHSQHLVLLKKA
ncbi:MAG: class I SAM-dependent methyltransferase, partial [Candidatus Aminicenantes bacterium]|nr:class I SAM-dependent methyltransferase [Candidatus Aminicenantes bacterium]